MAYFKKNSLSYLVAMSGIVTEHILKCYLMPNSPCFDSWCKELGVWFESAQDVGFLKKGDRLKRKHYQHSLLAKFHIDKTLAKKAKTIARNFPSGYKIPPDLTISLSNFSKIEQSLLDNLVGDEIYTDAEWSDIIRKLIIGSLDNKHA